MSRHPLYVQLETSHRTNRGRVTNDMFWITYYFLDKALVHGDPNEPFVICPSDMPYEFYFIGRPVRNRMSWETLSDYLWDMGM